MHQDGGLTFGSQDGVWTKSFMFLHMKVSHIYFHPSSTVFPCSRKPFAVPPVPLQFPFTKRAADFYLFFLSHYYNPSGESHVVHVHGYAQKRWYKLTMSSWIMRYIMFFTQFPHLLLDVTCLMLFLLVSLESENIYIYILYIYNIYMY